MIDYIEPSVRDVLEAELAARDRSRGGSSTADDRPGDTDPGRIPSRTEKE
jgi:hypothetical protein